MTIHDQYATLYLAESEYSDWYDYEHENLGVFVGSTGALAAIVADMKKQGPMTRGMMGWTITRHAIKGKNITSHHIFFQHMDVEKIHLSKGMWKKGTR